MICGKAVLEHGGLFTTRVIGDLCEPAPLPEFKRTEPNVFSFRLVATPADKYVVFTQHERLWQGK